MAVTPAKAAGAKGSDTGFLPMTRAEMTAKGWSELDVLILTGDAYVKLDEKAPWPTRLDVRLPDAR